MIEPFLGRLPDALKEDIQVDTFFRELTDWIEQGFRDFRQTEIELSRNDLIQNDFSSPNSNNQTNVDQEDQTQVQQSASSRTVDISGVTIEVLDGQVANVSRAGTALLEDNPSRDYRVEIRNSDGTQIKINGNGRLINGASEITIGTQFTVRVIQYFIDTDSYGVL